LRFERISGVGQEQSARAIAGKSMQLIAVAAWLAWPQSSQSAEDIPSTTFPQRTVGVSVTWDKEPCLMDTRYLREGTNAFRLMIAYTSNFQKAESTGTSTVWNVTLPAGYSSTRGSNQLLISPQGENLEFRDVSPPHRIAGGGRLVLLQKVTPGPVTPAVSPSSVPHIRILEPLDSVLSRPMIQIKGMSDKPLREVRYDLINDRGRSLGVPGFVTDSYFDVNLWKWTTNWFGCFDVELAPGTNLIRIMCVDETGRLVRTTGQFVLRFDLDKTPPLISVQWPRSDCELSGDSFTARGLVDDYTAKLVATISGGGRTESIKTLVERNGRFWVENIPFLARSNLLTLTATDAAGNSSTTNLLVVKSDSSISVDPVPADQLWQMQVTVTGKASPAQQNVWVNGRRAKVKPDGSWVAAGIPLDEHGTATFDVIAFVKTETPPVQPVVSQNTVAPMETVSVESSLASQPVTLNISQPAYGQVEIHLTGTLGRDFVLLASTNLINWTPILTNQNSAATFNFTDTNTAAYGCRFFRIVPLH
jgi:hypothetical protein